MRHSLTILSLFGLSLTVACADADDSIAQYGTGLRSIVMGAGVDGFDYTVTAVDCASGTPIAGGFHTTAHVDLIEGQTLPANLGDFLNKPFAPGSTHDFADRFFVVPAGCYDVSVTPFGEGEKTCSSALKKGIEVFEGETTETLLISQCEGVDKGALDAIVAVNNDPIIDDVIFPNSKFSCGLPIEICVVGSDPDNDPVRYAITFPEGTPCTVGAFAEGPLGACTTITCSAPGSYEPQIFVYDQAINNMDMLVDIETLLVNFGGAEGLTSHAELNAQIHVAGVLLYEDNDGDLCGDKPKFFCSGPQPGYVDSDGDCNDDDATVHPGATEQCGGVDLNCVAGDEPQAGVVLDYAAQGYRYKEYATGTVPGDVGSETFDDSDYSVGQAAFYGGDSAACPLMSSKAHGAWSLNSDIVLRRSINVPAGISALELTLQIDNDAIVYFNGTDISGGIQSHEGCADVGPLTLSVPLEVVRAGENEVVVHGVDRGAIAAVDLKIESVCAPI